MKSFHAAVKLSRGDRFIQTNKHQNHTFATTHPQRGPKSNNNRPEKKKIIFIVYAFTNLYFEGRIRDCRL